MLTGKPGDWYDDGHIFGYYDYSGNYVSFHKDED